MIPYAVHVRWLLAEQQYLEMSSTDKTPSIRESPASGEYLKIRHLFGHTAYQYLIITSLTA